MAAKGNFQDPDAYEKLQFYYHPDHLGSSSYITNLDGEVVQHIEYVPFGEVFFEERNNVWNTPYLFNAKEFDEETGLYYYGARYYDPRLSLWISIDPQSENYLNLSPYNYCANNPIIYRDEEGEWLNFVIGAGVGAATDYVAQVVGNLAQGKNFGDALTDVNGGEILRSAVAGAAGVGIANGFAKIAKVAKTVKVISESKHAMQAVESTANVVSDVTSSVASRIIKDEDITAIGVMSDVVGGCAGRATNKFVKDKYQTSSKGRLLQRQADHEERVASGSNPRQSRVEKAQRANEAYSSYGSTQAEISGSIVTNVVSQTTEKNFSKLKEVVSE